MNLFSIEEAGDKGASRPFPLHPKSPLQRLRFAPDTLRTFLVDEAEHFLHNHHASVASLRLLFTFVPERRSASLRNRCSPSPEYPLSKGEQQFQSGRDHFGDRTACMSEYNSQTSFYGQCWRQPDGGIQRDEWYLESPFVAGLRFRRQELKEK